MNPCMMNFEKTLEPSISVVDAVVIVSTAIITGTSFATADGLSDEEIVRVISDAVNLKQKELGGNSGPEDIASHKNRPMILIGG